MSLTNSESINMLTWSVNAGTFEIRHKTLYVSLVTLSTQDNAKLLKQLKSEIKGRINWCETNLNQKYQKTSRIIYGS